METTKVVMAHMEAIACTRTALPLLSQGRRLGATQRCVEVLGDTACQTLTAPE